MPVSMQTGYRIRGVVKIGDPILVGKGDAYEGVEFDAPWS